MYNLNGFSPSTLDSMLLSRDRRAVFSVHSHIFSGKDSSPP